MPYSFTEIEKDKTKTIGLVFSFLLFFYFLAIWLIVLVVKNYLMLEASDSSNAGYAVSPSLTLSETMTVLFVAALVGLGHWSMSVSNLIPKMARVMGAQDLDTRDTYHQMFRNIVDEVAVATGGKKIEAVVVPTMAMNAFALSDFSGRSVIGVTEGLLSRLNRAQIEAVVGHEAAHIVSGDCLATTVTTSLFALYNGLLAGITNIFRGSRGRSSSRSRGGGGIWALLLIIYLLLLITKFLSLMARMFISREREFRADAVAVRLTRDPLSLAEALYIISNRWRGAGLNSDDLEALFIINPQFSRLDERNGLMPDLFSTHPPVEARLKILLDLAKADVQTLEDSLKKSMDRPKQSVPESSPVSPGEWMVNRGGQWSGPFSFTQLGALPGLTPETWIRRNSGAVTQAFEDDQVRNIFEVRQKGEGGAALSNMCPRCRLPLSEVAYEGAAVLKCAHCGGVLLEESNVQRLIVREDMGFSERIAKIARAVASERMTRNTDTLDLRSVNALFCPHCNDGRSHLIRMFYTMAYPVEVDKCIQCGYIWFDKDELEVLQYLIEDNVNKDAES